MRPRGAGDHELDRRHPLAGERPIDQRGQGGRVRAQIRQALAQRVGERICDEQRPPLAVEHDHPFRDTRQNGGMTLQDGLRGLRGQARRV